MRLFHKTLHRFRCPLFVAFGLLALAAGCGGSSEPKALRPNDRSVVVIMVDTIRADRMQSYGYPRQTSPALERLGSRGTTFENATAASPWTGPSVASVITGLYPDQLGLDQLWSPLHPDATTLAEIYREREYKTSAVVSNGFLAPAFGMQQGYRVYTFTEYMDPDAEEEIRVFSAEEVTDAALDILDNVDEQPQFVYVHYTDPHAPYLATQATQERMVEDPAQIDTHLLGWERFAKQPLSEAQQTMVSQMYDAEIAFVDEQLGRLLEQIPEDWIVVLTGDHGEEFLDHGGYMHGHTVYQELLHVPLIVRGPGVCEGCRVEQPVSHVDLAATVLELTGLRPPELTAGSSLAPLLKPNGDMDPRTVFAVRAWEGSKTFAVRQGNWKMITDGRVAGLFDLAADPDELINVAQQRQDVLAQLMTALEAHLNSEKLRAGEEDTDWKEERIRQLKALGYI